MSVAAVSALALSAAPGLQAAATSPRLAVTASSPLVVRGRDFVAAERVLVTVWTAGRRASAATTATTSGVFVLRFTKAPQFGCTTLLIRATGSRGSTARLKIMPICPPGPNP
jgi:hypothetical protein